MRVDGGDAESLGMHLGRLTDEVSQVTAQTWVSGPTRFNEDMVVMPLQASTQWDALSHIYYDGRMYNGHPAAAVTSFGATVNSVDQVHTKGILGRGVLLDLARHRGVPCLGEQDIVLPEELDDVVRAQGVTIRAGDIVVTRTGWGWDHFRKLGDGEHWLAGTPGLSWRCAEWLHDHQVAAVASDNCSVETAAPEVDGVWLPFHLLTIREMGMMMGEIWQLEELAADCADDGIYEFQLIAPALRIIGAVGSPVNPIAVK
jgi:kynurenine formamidase